MAKHIDISTIVKKLLSDARFQDCIVNIVSELLEQATADKGLSSASKSQSQDVTPAAKTIQKDLSKVSSHCLRQMYYYRKKNGQSIEPELNAELASRFSRYNPQTQLFCNIIDFTKSSDDSLRHILAWRKKYGQEIEPELHAELTRRFPGYNPETQQFRKINRGVAFSKLSDDGLRTALKRRKKRGQEIEPELNAELVRRFPRYDPETLQFKRIHITDFTQLSDIRLRSMYLQRKKQGKEIEPELQAELTQRFPRYDSETQQFGKIDYAKSTDASLRSMYLKRKKRGKEIGPELQAELKRRFPGYNPETQLFEGTYSRFTDYTKSSDKSLRIIYFSRKKQGKEIEPELHAELARRFPGYNPETQQFERCKRQPVKVKKAPSVPNKVSVTTTVTTPKKPKAPSVSNKAPATTTVTTPKVDVAPAKPAQVSDKDLMAAYNMRKRACRVIGPELNAQLAERFPGEYDPINQTFVPKPAKEAHKPVQSAMPVDLCVTLKPRKMTLQDAYYDVIVNGKTILSNHVNTEVRTFMDGALLAVHGIVTENSDYPLKPIWLIFDARLQVNRFISRDRFSGYSTYINMLQETSRDLRAICSNRSTVILDYEKYKRIANGARFVIQEQTK